VPFLIQKFHRPIGSGAPGQRWDRIDYTPDAAFGGSLSAWLQLKHNIFDAATSIAGFNSAVPDPPHRLNLSHRTRPFLVESGLF
jgi:hypothetical protein